MAPIPTPFETTYARDLPGSYADCPPAPVSSPRLLFLNTGLAETLGLNPADLGGEAGATLFAGQCLPASARPIAQAYAGHQFGQFNPQLGDGRALLLGELIDRLGQRRDVAFKGSGRTPFSRGGDGKAGLGPMLREVLIGEALHALGVPSTRALAVVATGDAVLRDRPLPGAVLTRVAASHLRVGTVQWAAARRDRPLLERLVDYTLNRHFGGAPVASADGPRRAWLVLLQEVVARQASLVAQWMNLGFIHGVMNTDNMALSGESIDFGPCAFMEAMDRGAVFSSIDHQGRYAWDQQPGIAQWNLARLAEALLPLALPEDEDDTAVALATEAVVGFAHQYEAARLAGLRAKLGLAGEDPGDADLAQDWLTLLEAQSVDHTLAWRRLVDGLWPPPAGGLLHPMFADGPALDTWLVRWRHRAGRDGRPLVNIQAQMLQHNPVVIPRNHRVEAALAAASEHGDLAPFEALLEAVRRPFDEPADPRDAEPAPRELTARYRTFCGT